MSDGAAQQINAFFLAARFIGLRETPGAVSNPAILAMLKLVDPSVHSEETPWCGAFMEFVAWIANRPRPRSLRARAWLNVGDPVALADAKIGWDVVILQRGAPPQPGPEVIAAPGHVGLFAGFEPGRVLVLGGNQNNSVSIMSFPRSAVLGVRRLAQI